MINLAVSNEVGQSENPTYLHGVFVEIFGKGVLLTGPSGIGKSEAALTLVDRGNYLITDDVVQFQLSSCGKKIWGVCPTQKFKGFLEVRGLGIFNIVSLFGACALKSKASLDLICQFVSTCTVDRAERIESKENIFGLSIPKVTLPVYSGRNIALLVEVLVRMQQ